MERIIEMLVLVITALLLPVAQADTWTFSNEIPKIDTLLTQDDAKILGALKNASTINKKHVLSYPWADYSKDYSLNYLRQEADAIGRNSFNEDHGLVHGHGSPGLSTFLMAAALAILFMTFLLMTYHMKRQSTLPGSLPGCYGCCIPRPASTSTTRASDDHTGDVSTIELCEVSEQVKSSAREVPQPNVRVLYKR
ncbi:hypothetical protein LSTR_LSTR016267 [Laodelphax striatellus]|uniref:Uncharacterized protein n=1 Tax=Laodelphax striatellus TaxID=195883 RepID=A0A482WPV0_LAOST|nr:hypothetical protein LSTR_LSTR016267 [Laodelphax striatellus]